MFDKQRFNLMSISGSGPWIMARAAGSTVISRSNELRRCIVRIHSWLQLACILALRCVLANCVHRPSAGTMQP